MPASSPIRCRSRSSIASRWCSAAIMDVGLRGIYMSNYFPFDGHNNAELAKQEYGWLEANQEFDRTYRRVSNVDDMHENGVHDYMKFIKLGYGRASDHAQ